MSFDGIPIKKQFFERFILPEKCTYLFQSNLRGLPMDEVVDLFVEPTEQQPLNVLSEHFH